MSSAGEIDENLLFFKEMTSSDLDNLYTILVYGNREDRICHQKNMMENLSKHTKVQLFFPDHAHYYDLLAKELCEFSGNAFFNLYKPYKISYRDVLIDVCYKLKVKVSNEINTLELEETLILGVIKKAVSLMTHDELKAFATAFGLVITNYTDTVVYASFKQELTLDSFRFYQIAIIVTNMMLKRLAGVAITFLGDPFIAAFSKAIARPIEMIVLPIWESIDTTSPGYRIIIPAVLAVILLRNQNRANKSAQNRNQEVWLSSIRVF